MPSAPGDLMAPPSVAATLAVAALVAWTAARGAVTSGLPGRPRPPSGFPGRCVSTRGRSSRLCAALALAEAVLVRLGRPAEAARMAAVFERTEAHLAG